MFRGPATCLFVLLGTFAAEACSCGGGPAVACQAAWSKGADAIFVGRVVKIEERSEEGAVHLSVSEGFRGVNEGSVEVFTGSTTCSFPFKEGEEYLIYAASWKDKWFVDICSATRPLQYVPAEDLVYLRSIRTRPPTSWVYGTLKRYTFDPTFKPTFQPSIMDHYRPAEEAYRALSPESGTKVIVKGNGRKRTTVVDQDGKWIVKDLPPGTYTVTAQLSAGLVPAYDKVSLAPKACAELDLRTQLDGHITGTILLPPRGGDWVAIKVFALRIGDDAADLAMRDPTSVRIRGAAQLLDQIYFPEVRPEPRFNIGPLPEGEYVLAIYLTRQIKTAYGTTFRDARVTFFPGVDDAAHATRITLGAGEKLSGYRIPLKHTEVEE